ncbi:hypothetical protein CROQUDRAFT_36959, partial [Cronartium quercuum f. sp. fusiforme G11]
LYLLHKLITRKMSGDDMLSHLEAMHCIFEKLNTLIMPLNPLTRDDIFTAALFISLPSDWLPVITPLIQLPSVTLARVIQVITSEDMRQKMVNLSTSDVLAS